MRSGVLLMAALLASLVLATGAKDQAADRRSLSVVGRGEVRAAPDRAVMSLSVTTRADAAERAAVDNARRTRAVLDAVRKQLGREDRAESLSYNIQPVFEYPKGGPRQRVGFEVVNQIRVITSAIDRVGSIFDAASGAADVQVAGLRFELSNRSEVQAEALHRAARAAQKRASKIADGIGVTLRRVRHIQERGMRPPQPRPMMRAEMARADAETPILPQEQVVVGEVEVTYDIE